MAVFFLFTDDIYATNNMASITPDGETEEERQHTMEMVNADGGIEAWALPNTPLYAYYNACSPILVKHFIVKYVCDGNPAPAGAKVFNWPIRPNPHFYSFSVYIDENENDFSEVSLPIYKEVTDTEPFVTLKANAYKGMTTFDIAPIARALMGNGIQEWPSDAGYVFTDSGLSTIIRPIDAEIEVLCVNGKDEDWGDNAGHETGAMGAPVLLSKTHDFIKWSQNGGSYWDEGLPEITILNTSDETKTIGSAELPPYSVSRIRFSTQAGLNALTSYFTGKFTLTTRSLDGCSPFMVHWLNNDGGVDMYVFKRHQEYQLNTKTNASRMLLPDNIGHRVGSRRAYDIKAERFVICGENLVSNEHYDLLEGLAASSLIDYYYERGNNTPKWIAALGADFKGKRNSETNTQDYEITLQLPDYPTQNG